MRWTLTTKRTLGLLMALGLAATVAACNGGGDTPAPAPEAPTEAPAPEGEAEPEEAPAPEGEAAPEGDNASEGEAPEGEGSAE